MTLWGVLEKKGTDRQRAMVQGRIQDAETLLTLVRDTFPNYTLHDHHHAENVVTVIENLLGAQHIESLSALEAAILLLAAYYHDLGMVVRKSELQGIQDEPEFARYLTAHPEAYVEIKRNGKVSADIAEDYCRWRHADRVHIRLNEFPEEDFFWDNGVPLRTKLIDLCRSHNLPAKSLDDFETDFLGGCDLRFCAILLRLGDILDFDSSRAPRVLYEHLGIYKRSSPAVAISDNEWNKHLASAGFVFPDGNRGDRYTLYFGAGSRKPSVEYEIRKFLDVIELEIGLCREILNTCSARWRDLPLPGQIDRKAIQSIGYKYGDFRFHLDRESVLNLFTGDRLYADVDVFIRELLQNSIDATRLRCALQGQDSNDSKFDIHITNWRDDKGYEWLRIDDCGIGMDETIVQKYLMQVGVSYYNSADFEADLLRYRADRNTTITPSADSASASCRASCSAT